MERAVVERIVKDLAVLRVGQDAREVAFVLSELPPGTRVGARLRIALQGARLLRAEMDTESPAPPPPIPKSRLSRFLGRRPGFWIL